MKIILTATILITSFYFYAQNQRNFWYFGAKAGIDFNSGTAVALLDGQMNSYEGCASVSDVDGNLLFYTNGGPFNNLGYTGGVWNRNHELMPNGLLTSVYSCNSAAQSSIIVPDPKNQYKYYVFTTDCAENGIIGGLRYFIVDMDLDNGLGDVVVKDVQVLSNVTESIAAIRHANEQDYWLITTDFVADEIISLLVSKDGVTPGQSMSLGYNFNQTAGQINTTSDGRKIGFSATYKTFLIDFNNDNGSFSNILTLDIESIGCAFSPNNKVFYANKISIVNAPIYQYNLDAVNIPSSVYVVNSNTWLGNMQLAPDGKIYLAKNDATSLPVINNPNEIGIGCNYAYPGFYLGGRQSKGGLPNFVNESIYSWCDSYSTLEAEFTDVFYSPSGNYIWNSSGAYKDTISNSNGCDSLISINLTQASSNKIKEFIFDERILVYPNPSNGLIYVNIGETRKEIKFELFDHRNRLIKTSYFEDAHLLNFDFSNLSPGVYTGLLDLGNSVEMIKLVIKE